MIKTTYRLAKLGLVAVGANTLYQRYGDDARRLIAKVTGGQAPDALAASAAPGSLVGVVAGAPSDNTTLAGVASDSASDGFSASMTVTRDSTVRCGRCGVDSAPELFGIEALRRLEGASDPDDMSAVIATHCPLCGAAGTLVVAYGPDSAAEDADVLTAMRDERATSAIPTGAGPGEAVAG